MVSLRFRLILAFSLCAPLALRAQGLITPGAGPVHRAMGGASTAAPTDAAGAMYWNPAAISALDRSEMMFGAELIYVDAHLASTGPMGAGVTRSDSGIANMPTIALVHHLEGTNSTFGLGVQTLAGASVNYPGDLNNPILAGNRPLVQLGPQFSSIAAFVMAPTFSTQVTD
ncbi:MAG: outer membrane protein transport protein, partial [Planctomycetales bacterium]